jgi:O-phospho-L-seryl-tRNASec:L-selenocysteinyl-tRNA synthase
LQSAPACHALNEACRGGIGCGGSGAAGAGDGADNGGDGADNGGDGAAGGASGGTSGDGGGGGGGSASSGGGVIGGVGGGGGGGSGYRVDAWVASTDKNFMVPVGGALVGSPLPDVVEAVSRAYPGRASAAPVVDLFITLLQMGQPGLQALLAQRRRVFARLLAAMEGVAARCGERVLRSPRNAVSIAMTIDSITAAPPPGAGAGAGEGGGDDAASAGAASGGLGGSGGGDSVGGSAAGGGGSRAGSGAPGGAATYLGSMLFSRGVSGTRVVAPGERRAVGPLSFVGYGASCDDYGCAYLTAAAGIGMTEADVDDFAERLESTIRDYRRQAVAAAAAVSVRGGGAGGAGRSDAAAR